MTKSARVSQFSWATDSTQVPGRMFRKIKSIMRVTLGTWQCEKPWVLPSASREGRKKKREKNHWWTPRQRRQGSGSLETTGRGQTPERVTSWIMVAWRLEVTDAYEHCTVTRQGSWKLGRRLRPPQMVMMMMMMMVMMATTIRRAIRTVTMMRRRKRNPATTAYISNNNTCNRTSYSVSGSVLRVFVHYV